MDAWVLLNDTLAQFRVLELMTARETLNVNISSILKDICDIAWSSIHHTFNSVMKSTKTPPVNQKFLNCIKVGNTLETKVRFNLTEQEY